MMSLFFVVAAVVVCSYLTYILFLKHYWYWKREHVPHVKPNPLVGNIGGFLFQTQPLSQCVQRIYDAHPNARYVGFHKLMQPALLIKDPELIKTVTVRNWQSFSHHAVVVSEDVDPLWGYSIVAMKGNELWRQMRSILSFAFTSSKLKKMFGLMKNCCNQFAEHLEKEEGEIINIDIREAFSKYTNDVIGSTAFGFKCNSFEQPRNDFYLMGKTATNFEGMQALKFFLNGLSPFLMSVMNMGIYSQSVRDFFYNLITDTLKQRRDYKIIRHDMLQLMLDAKENGFVENTENGDITELTNNSKTNKLVIDDNIITAQALIFFIGGFDSTASVMSFTAYELACNLDVQEVLRSEVDLAFETCNGDITYDALTNMKYLDMVVSEALRKWPSILVSDRAVVKPHTIDSHKKGTPPIKIDTDVCYAIPIFSIHRDPKHYPNPEKFDPERFSDENKANIKPYTYLPFGSGPRGCIGSRFALLEIKLIIAELIHKFEIIPVAKTQIPLKLSARGFLLRPKDPIILGLKRRSSIV